jgi:hypothetical protein
VVLTPFGLPATAVAQVALITVSAFDAIVFVWRFLPETKGLAVEDIVKLFEPNRQPPATSGQPAAARE